ncbi:MAG: tetratricopeptide repeat protein [Verrucomicrobium sp.]|nr:tetratricopeptide repeat protein [Verrucomicrobium sp.]
MSDPDSIKHELQAVLGYCDLGMWDEALAEVDEAESRQAEGPSAKLDELRLNILQRAERWTTMREIAARAAEREPVRPAWFLSWAYALRREVSIPAAREILEKALRLHPAEALISFNLACYAAQLDECEAAARHLAQALRLDPKLAKNAQNDPDLAPLRNRGPLPAPQSPPPAILPPPKTQQFAAPKAPALPNESAALRVYVRHLTEGDAAARAVALHALVQARAEPVFTALLASEQTAVSQLASQGLWECWLNEAGPAARHLIEKGVQLMEKSDFPVAERLFRRLMNDYPDWAEAVNKLATLCYLSKRYEESLSLCRRVVTMKPDHFGAWQGIELCAVQMKDWSVALEAAKQSLRLQPQHPAHRKLVESLEAKLGGEEER